MKDIEEMKTPSIKRKVDEGDEERKKIKFEEYCILCQTYGHIFSEECVTCLNCSVKGHCRRDCSELKNVREEKDETKKEAMQLESDSDITGINRDVITALAMSKECIVVNVSISKVDDTTKIKVYCKNEKEYVEVEIKKERKDEYIEREIKEECFKLEMKEECIKPEIKTECFKLEEEYIEYEISKECLKLESREESIKTYIKEECLKFEVKEEYISLELKDEYLNPELKREYGNPGVNQAKDNVWTPRKMEVSVDTLKHVLEPRDIMVDDDLNDFSTERHRQQTRGASPDLDTPVKSDPCLSMFQCRKCKTKTEDRFAMLTHMKDDHGLDESVQVLNDHCILPEILVDVTCKFCPKVWTRKDWTRKGLRKHFKKKKHKGIFSKCFDLQCRICSVSFPINCTRDMDRHIEGHSKSYIAEDDEKDKKTVVSLRSGTFQNMKGVSDAAKDVSCHGRRVDITFNDAELALSFFQDVCKMDAKMWSHSVLISPEELGYQLPPSLTEEQMMRLAGNNIGEIFNTKDKMTVYWSYMFFMLLEPMWRKK